MASLGTNCSYAPRLKTFSQHCMIFLWLSRCCRHQLDICCIHSCVSLSASRRVSNSSSSNVSLALDMFVRVSHSHTLSALQRANTQLAPNVHGADFFCYNYSIFAPSSPSRRLRQRQRQRRRWRQRRLRIFSSLGPHTNTRTFFSRYLDS